MKSARWGLLAVVGLLAMAVVGPVRSAGAATRTVAGGYQAVSPTRVLDSRSDLGMTGPLAGLGQVTVPLTGVAGVPASGVSAVVVNLTATQSAQDGYLAVGADGAPKPATSSVNLVPGGTAANLTVVPIGADGKGVIYNGSPGATQVIADVFGYYTLGSPGAGGYGAVAPTRVVDTRIGLGLPGPFAATGQGSVTVEGQAGAPASGVSAVLINLTATASKQAGYLTVAADGSPKPATSNLNLVPGGTAANLAVVPVGADGKISITSGSAGTTQVIIDVFGYFTKGPPGPGGTGSLAPSRLVDTRNGIGTPKAPVAGSGGHITVQVSGQDGVPASGVSAVVVNLTTTNVTADGYLAIGADGSAAPGTSNLNFTSGQTVANLVVAPVGADGKIDIYNGSPEPADAIVDVYGYITAPTTAPDLTLPATALQTAVAGTAYGPVTLTSSGGLAPITWSATNLPPGLSLDPTGVLSGTPTATGDRTATVTATDATGETATEALNVNVDQSAAAPGLTDTRWTGADVTGPVTCPTATTCYVATSTNPANGVGSAGTGVDKSTDGGTTWNPLTVPTSTLGADVVCSDAQTCWTGATVGNGPVERTTDGGLTWTLQPNGLEPIACPTATDCLSIVSTNLAITTDGGTTWTQRPLPQASQNLGTVSCSSVAFCAITAGDLVMTTTNFGSTVTTHSESFGGGGIACPADGTCYVITAGNGPIERTTDGGATFTAGANVPFPYPNEISCPSVTACRVATDSALAVTNDSGQTFSSETTPFIASSVSCPSAGFCAITPMLASGLQVEPNVVATTTTAGTAWTTSPLPPRGAVVTQVSCPTSAVCFGVLSPGTSLPTVVVRSTDGEQSWVQVFAPGANSSGPALLSCPTASTCVAVQTVSQYQPGFPTPTNYSSTLVTHDGGATWATVALPEQTSIYAISCASGLACQVVGGSYGNYAFGTTDGGQTWQIEAPASGGYVLNGVSCQTATTCVAVGARLAGSESGEVITKSTDGGATWSIEENSSDGDPLAAVDCPTASFCIAAGGTSVRTSTDGGTTWGAPTTLGPKVDARGVSCTSATTCLVVGATGATYYPQPPYTALETTDGGAIYQPLALPMTDVLNTVSCLPGGTCDLGGAGGGQGGAQILTLQP